MILASKSPQRKNILKSLGFDFRVVPSGEEEIFNPADSPEKIAQDLAQQKALSVAKKYPSELVLGVDTLVVNKMGEILGKPKNRAEAGKMILDKSNSTEIIISGMALIKGDKSIESPDKCALKQNNLFFRENTFSYEQPWSCPKGVSKKWILSKKKYFGQSSYSSGLSIIKYEITEVHFGEISEKDAEKILSFDEWQGRSGAFSVEGKTRLYIRGISGDFWNVVGLPVYLLGKMMKEIEIE